MKHSVDNLSLHKVLLFLFILLFDGWGLLILSPLYVPSAMVFRRSSVIMNVDKSENLAKVPLIEQCPVLGDFLHETP